jgi:hypothetical protein
MIKFQQVLLGLVLVLSTFVSNAQVFEIEGSVDEKYTPPEGSIFDTEEKSSNNSAYVNYEYKNAIQFNVTSVARGAAALQYERALTSNIVLMGTGGVTIFQDVIKTVLLGYVFDAFGSSERYSLDNSLDKMGIFWGGEFKGYFGEAFNDEFVSFGVRNFSYNLNWIPSSTSYNGSSNISLASFSQQFKETNRDFYIGYGYSSVFNKNLIGELSINAGIRRIKSSEFSIEDIYNFNSNTSYSTIRLKETEFVQLVPTLFVSYKLGFAFEK